MSSHHIMSSPVPLTRSKRSWSVPTAVKIDEIFDSGYSPKPMSIARSTAYNKMRPDAVQDDVTHADTNKQKPN